MSTRTLNHHDEAVPARRVRPDDFVRLGIGISEARVGVIRRAAHAASAAVLAKSDQDSDSRFDDKLARIATSTYRILDPRGRNLFAQRIQLLHFESPPAEVPPWWEVKPTPIMKAISAKDRFDPNAAEETYVPGVPEPPRPWDAVTQQLGLPPVSRSAATIAASSVALLFVSLVVVVSLRSRTETGVVDTAGSGQVVADVSEPVQKLPEAFAPRVEPQPPESGTVPPKPAAEIAVEPAESVEPSNTAETPADPNTPLAASGMDSSRQGEASIQQEPGVEIDASRKAVSEFADTEIFDSPDTLGSLHAESTSAMLAAGAASGISEPEIAETPNLPLKTFDPSIPKTDDVIVDPLEIPDSFDELDKTLTSPLGSTISPTMDPLLQVDSEETNPEAAPIKDPRYPIPDSEALATAVGRMQRLVADLPDAGEDLNSVADIRAIRETILQCEPGSEDRWVLTHEALRRLVLVGRDATARVVIGKLIGEYQTDELFIRNELLQEISSAKTIVQNERVVRWALQTGELALASEDFESATAATRSATTIAVRLGDGELRSRTSNQIDTIRQAKRMATAAGDVIKQSTFETASASEANSVGRYLCLYRRDWQQGLPWLTRVSSPKIAQAAQRELDREDDNAMALVDAWVEVASDERGRTAESILLHGRDLASTELETSTGLEAKDVQRRIEEIDAKLPADLRLPSTDTDDVLPAAVPQDRLTGMLGRIKADGLDVGALVRYEPGLGLTRQAFSQILDQLGVQAGIVSAEFVGLIDLKENSTIRFVAGGATQPGDSVAVTVADNAVALRENAPRDRHAGEIDLPAGTHLVRWQFGGKVLDTCHLSIEDARDKKAVTIRHTLALIRQVSGPSAPRLRVNVIGAR